MLGYGGAIPEFLFETLSIAHPIFKSDSHRGLLAQQIDAAGFVLVDTQHWMSWLVQVIAKNFNIPEGLARPSRSGSPPSMMIKVSIQRARNPATAAGRTGRDVIASTSSPSPPPQRPPGMTDVGALESPASGQTSFADRPLTIRGALENPWTQGVLQPIRPPG